MKITSSAYKYAIGSIIFVLFSAFLVAGTMPIKRVEAVSGCVGTLGLSVNPTSVSSFPANITVSYSFGSDCGRAELIVEGRSTDLNVSSGDTFNYTISGPTDVILNAYECSTTTSPCDANVLVDSRSVHVSGPSAPKQATISVDPCPEGGTWSLSPGGETASPASVNADPNGTTYTLNYAAPLGYTSTIYPSSSQLVFPGGTYSYTVKCAAKISPPKVTISGTATANPSGGQSIDVNWSSTDANSCSSLDIPNLNPTGPTSGSDSFLICSDQNIALHISCTGPGGTTDEATTVWADPNAEACGGANNTFPSVDLEPKSVTVAPGSNVTLSWTSKNATSCYADPNNPWTQKTSTSGSDVISNIQTSTTYSMICKDSSGKTAKDSANITVSTPTPPPPVNPPPSNPPPPTFGGGGNPSTNPNPGKTGTPIDFVSCTLFGGKAPYHYIITSTDIPAGFSDLVGDSSQNPIHVSHTFDTIGTYGYKWYITDANGAETSCSDGKVKVLLNATFIEF